MLLRCGQGSAPAVYATIKGVNLAMLFLRKLPPVIGTSFLILTSLYLSAQQPPSQPAAGSAAASTPASGRESVSATQAVITIQGVCNPDHASAADPASCVTTMTREQFEGLIKALNSSGQPVTDLVRQNLAKNYAELLPLEAAARRSGIEDTPEFHQVMEVLRLRAATDLYRQSLERKFRDPSPDEIAAYYHEHVGDFERVQLSRILIPRRNPAANAAEFEKKALDAANTAHTRAAKGDPPSQIQSEVYSALGIKGPPPMTDLGRFARSDLIEKESADVFVLRAGEVTGVEAEPANYVIYKVTGKETLALDQVKDDLARKIEQKKLKDAIQAATASTHANFNEQYFGPGINTPPATNVQLPVHSSH